MDSEQAFSLPIKPSTIPPPPQTLHLAAADFFRMLCTRQEARSLGVALCGRPRVGGSVSVGEDARQMDRTPVARIRRGAEIRERQVYRRLARTLVNSIAGVLHRSPAFLDPGKRTKGPDFPGFVGLHLTTPLEILRLAPHRRLGVVAGISPVLPLLFYPASMEFRRLSHSSSSTTSKFITLLRMAGTKSAQFLLAACSEQRSNTPRL